MPSNRSAQGVLNSAAAPGEERNSAKTDAGYSRETVLLSSIGLLLLLLAVTAFVTRMYHKKVHVLADEWYARGEAEFSAGKALEAARDYRNALVYSEGNTLFQFHLAQALTAANRPDTDEEAQSYLLNLLAESPGSGEINLELAHISARQKTGISIQDTLRYYYGAIYGVWQDDPLAKRWDARLELCEYLLAHGMTAQAQPQTIALAGDVPPSDVTRQKEAAALLMRAELWDRALEEYRLILSSHRRDSDALAGEGISAFQLGQYALAVQDLDVLPRSMRVQPEIGYALALSREVQAINPFLNGEAPRERARRTVEALTRAAVLLQSCSQQSAASVRANTAPPSASNSARAKSAPDGAPSKKPAPAKAANASSANSAAPNTGLNNTLSQLQAALAQNSRAWRELNFIRNPDQIEVAMSWVFQVENSVARACGPPDNLTDRALLLVAKSRMGSEA
jgi:tetratricopeptide (TPR) repeat protein